MTRVPPPRTRLFLLGDVDALDALAEIASRLRYDELRRADELGLVAGGLGPDDHVVVGAVDPRRARALLSSVLAAGDPGYVGLCGRENDALVALLQLAAERVPKAKIDRVRAPAGAAAAVTPDEIAICVAAELVIARRGRTIN